jgi:hypothetical protein
MIEGVPALNARARQRVNAGYPQRPIALDCREKLFALDKHHLAVGRTNVFCVV